MDDGILGPISHHHEEGTLLLLEAISDERGDTGVSEFIVSSQSLQKALEDISYTALRDIFNISARRHRFVPIAREVS